MELPLEFEDGQKFAFLALENCSSSVGQWVRLADNTEVGGGIPVALSEWWIAWLGQATAERLRESTLVVLRRAPSKSPELLNGEHHELGDYVRDLFWLLQLCGVPYYEGASLIKGSALGGRVDVYQASEMKFFYRSEGAIPVSVSVGMLEGAARVTVEWRRVLAERQKFGRFKRGLEVLLEGLQQRFGQERLHQCVRALEALILPTTGETKRQFVNRCQTFAVRNASATRALQEAFEMRSDVEHMHQWDRSLSAYQAAEREFVAWRRTRQMERLASEAYRRVLVSPDVRRYFETDGDLAGYWGLTESQRAGTWGAPLDLEAVT